MEFPDEYDRRSAAAYAAGQALVAVLLELSLERATCLPEEPSGEAEVTFRPSWWDETLCVDRNGGSTPYYFYKIRGDREAFLNRVIQIMAGAEAQALEPPHGDGSRTDADQEIIDRLLLDYIGATKPHLSDIGRQRTRDILDRKLQRETSRFLERRAALLTLLTDALFARGTLSGPEAAAVIGREYSTPASAQSEATEPKQSAVRVPDRNRERREYLRKRGSAVTKVTALGSAFVTAFVATVVGAVGFLVFNTCIAAGIIQQEPAISFATGGATLCGLIGACSGFSAISTWITVKDNAAAARKIAYVPPVIASNLPAGEVLVRGAEKPAATNEMLLRVAWDAGEELPEEMLRSSRP